LLLAGIWNYSRYYSGKTSLWECLSVLVWPVSATKSIRKVILFTGPEQAYV